MIETIDYSEDDGVIKDGLLIFVGMQESGVILPQNVC